MSGTGRPQCTHTVRDLSPLCKRMMDKGFTHASFLEMMDLATFHMQSSPKQGVGPKPSGIYFYKLEEYGTDENKEYTPEFFQFFMHEKYMVDVFAKKDIMFIKAGREKREECSILDASDQRFDAYVPNLTSIDWGRMQSDGFGGVCVEGTKVCELRVWTVDTIVAWDNRCGLVSPDNFEFFPNAGEFKYETAGTD